MHAPLGNITHWWWVRHAPVVDGGKRISGRRDVAADLSDTAALQVLSARLPQGAVWVTSNLGRAIETAACLGAKSALEEPDLAEQDFGAWAGKTWDEVGTKGEATRFWAAPATVPAPGGESFADVCGRVNGVVEKLTAEHKGRHIIAVAHAGTIRAALAQAYGLSPEKALAFEVQNLSLTRIDHDVDGCWRVIETQTQV